MRNFQKMLEDAGFKTRSYSGRGMFGRWCLGVEFEPGDTVLDMVYSLLQQCQTLEEAQLVGDHIRGSSTDSMGRGQIIYWPGEGFYVKDPELCPTCGGGPGDGLTDGCIDEDGCGHWRQLQKT